MTPIEAACRAVSRELYGTNIDSDFIARLAVKTYLEQSVKQVASSGTHSIEGIFAAPNTFDIGRSLNSTFRSVFGTREANTEPQSFDVTDITNFLKKDPASGAPIFTRPFTAKFTREEERQLKLRNNVAEWITDQLITCGMLLETDLFSLNQQIHDIADDLDLLELIMTAEEYFDIMLPDGPETDALVIWDDLVNLILSRLVLK